VCDMQSRGMQLNMELILYEEKLSESVNLL